MSLTEVQDAGSNPVMNVDPSGLFFSQSMVPSNDPLQYSIDNTLNLNQLNGFQLSFEQNLANASYNLSVQQSQNIDRNLWAMGEVYPTSTGDAWIGLIR